MAETAARTVPDFWGFLQQTVAALDEESAKVKSDDDMKNLVDRWLRPENGVLAKLEDDPFFALAKPGARQIFMDTMRNRVRQVEREWRDIWRLLHESESGV
jgi:hypothetical protein